MTFSRHRPSPDEVRDALHQRLSEDAWRSWIAADVAHRDAWVAWVRDTHFTGEHERRFAILLDAIERDDLSYAEAQSGSWNETRGFAPN